MKLKNFVFITILLCSINANAQLKQIELQAAGLTCSMCSKAVYTALIKVNFVKSVASNIKNSTYTIQLKNEAIFDFDVLKNAVVDAGFSVANLSATINLNNIKVATDTHEKIDGRLFHFIDTQPQTLTGVYSIRIIDKNFVTNKEFKTFGKLTQMQCYQTGKLGSCCNKNMGKSGERIYHVKLNS